MGPHCPPKAGDSKSPQLPLIPVFSGLSLGEHWAGQAPLGGAQTVANLKFHRHRPPAPRCPLESTRRAKTLRPADPLALGRPVGRRPFHISGRAGAETKWHPQGRTTSRQQRPYNIGHPSRSWALDPVQTTRVFPFLPPEGEIQACNNTAPLFSSGQKSKLESDKSEINVNFLIGLREAGRGVTAGGVSRHMLLSC